MAAERKVCPHLVAHTPDYYYQRFSGGDREYQLVCEACRRGADEIDATLQIVSPERFAEIEAESWWEGLAGRPTVRIGRDRLRFEHDEFTLPELAALDVLDLQPIVACPDVWLAAATDGALARIDLAARTVVVDPRWPEGIVDPESPVMLRVSRRGDFAAIVNKHGRFGGVVETSSGRLTLRLDRGSYYETHCVYSVAFVETDERLLVVHATAWNRLDVSDALTGELLTARSPTSYRRDETRPEHYLDYFHCALRVSPHQRFVADAGWVWHPQGIVTAWSLNRWLRENVWESEDGPSRRSLLHRNYHRDAPACWLDDERLAVWGYGPDESEMFPAVCIFEVTSGRRTDWFPGPHGALAFDENLFSWDETGASAWDVATGERIGFDASLSPCGFHPASRRFLTLLPEGRVRLSRTTPIAENEAN